MRTQPGIPLTDAECSASSAFAAESLQAHGDSHGKPRNWGIGSGWEGVGRQREICFLKGPSRLSVAVFARRSPCRKDRRPFAPVSSTAATTRSSAAHPPSSAASSPTATKSFPLTPASWRGHRRIQDAPSPAVHQFRRDARGDPVARLSQVSRAKASLHARRLHVIKPRPAVALRARPPVFGRDHPSRLCEAAGGETVYSGRLTKRPPRCAPPRPRCASTRTSGCVV